MTEARGGALRAVGLTRRFRRGDAPAVDGVGFEVGPGELLALVGASGSGKTTTLRMLAGFEPPDAGTVSVIDAAGRERDITRETPQRRGFGMVFQHYALFPHMTVAENVAFGLEARRVARRERLAKAERALDEVGLGGAGARQVQSLSGGEQQRVALARALVIEPPVLLLDEPLSNLDPSLRQATREQLRAMLHGLRVTAVFVTHDQEDAFAIADRVAMLHKGRLLQVDTPEAMYAAPATVEVARFVGRGSLLPASVEDGAVMLRVGGVDQRARRATPRVDAPVAATGRTLAVVRPEMLALEPPGTPGAWPARVVQRRFAGGHFAYTVELSGSGGTTVEVADARGAAPEGGSVGVRLAADEIAVVVE